MNIGDKVKILECHATPELVGRQAKVVAMMDPAMSKYPIAVVLDGEALTFETPFGPAHTQGPFPFRENELELVGAGQPQANADGQPGGKTELPKFLKQMDGEEPQV
ncbi:MAG: hypothetical protein Q8P59_07245 [Dehalococcoidia bacterium]|nr:hypothetical protein [Dehalococcoidia bacterium]